MIEGTGELVREWRKARKLTQLELAKKAGISERALRDIERGGVRPQSTTIRSLARALGVRYRDILGTEFDEFNETGGGPAGYHETEYLDPTDPGGLLGGRYL
jgi:transcriptional regulator with XRE-family HTH domain